MGAVDNEKALGQRPQSARQKAGLTQQELCQQAGLSYSTLAKIERGAIRSPSVFTVAAIAAATNTPIDNLLGIKSAKATAPSAKKVSKTGIRFVYFDVNGTLVRFYHRAFTQIAHDSGQPADVVDTVFWRHNDAAATSRISLEQFNAELSKELGAKIDWHKAFMTDVQAMPKMDQLLAWVAEHYELGIISNNLPGFIPELRRKKVIPELPYTTIIDSSEVKLLKPDERIYQLAEKQAGVKPAEILLVDDTRANLTAADRRGWHVLWFDEMDPAKSQARIKKSLEF